MFEIFRLYEHKTLFFEVELTYMVAALLIALIMAKAIFGESHCAHASAKPKRGTPLAANPQSRSPLAAPRGVPLPCPLVSPIASPRDLPTVWPLAAALAEQDYVAPIVEPVAIPRALSAPMAITTPRAPARLIPPATQGHPMILRAQPKKKTFVHCLGCQ